MTGDDDDDAAENTTPHSFPFGVGMMMELPLNPFTSQMENEIVMEMEIRNGNWWTISMDGQPSNEEIWTIANQLANKQINYK